MKYIKSFLCFFILSCSGLNIQAQNAISATGGNATGSGGSVSYTVGQAAYTYLSGSNGNVTQGVQQPYEVSVVTAIENTSMINLECIVYPNPTGGVTKLILESFNNEEMKYQLFDLNGVILLDKKVESRETEISMENLPSSMYFLRVIKNHAEVKIFKIVKR
jgi:hypothetical protein